MVEQEYPGVMRHSAGLNQQDSEPSMQDIWYGICRAGNQAEIKHEGWVSEYSDEE